MSPVLRGGVPPVHVKVPVAGWPELCLIVTDEGDYTHDVANWGEAKIVAADGTETHLDELAPLSAEQAWGAFKRDNRSTVGGPLQIAERVFAYGLGTHGKSVIRYELPPHAERFEAWAGVDASRGREGQVRFIVAPTPAAAQGESRTGELWDWLAREFPGPEDVRSMRWEREDRIWEPGWEDVRALAQRYAEKTPGMRRARAAELAGTVRAVERLWEVRSLYYQARCAAAAIDEVKRFNFGSLRLAMQDLTRRFGARYPKGAEYQSRLDELEKALAVLAHDESNEQIIAAATQLRGLQRAALLDNPLLDFDELLLIRRSTKLMGLPANWQGNSSIPSRGYNNEIAALSPAPGGKLRTLFRPARGEFVGDMELHWDGEKVLFSSIGSHDRWQVFELGSHGEVRQVTPGDQPDVDNYDACYLPDERIIFCSTAGLAGVPCVDGNDHVATLFLLEKDGRTIRQLGFDQDHNWCPSVLNDGRVLYQRWEYADTPHTHTRLLFRMNPDGTGQEEFYGSNSYWPNSIFYARAIPGHATQVVAVVGGHHGVPRMGELVIFDPAHGRQEASGAVQRIPGYGRKVEATVRDNLVDESWPKYLHPYPLDEKYYLVSAKPTPQSDWGVYLVDTFDNQVLLAEQPGQALLEPTPRRKRPRPPIIPDRVDPSRKDASVFLADVYQGDGLKGVPRGTVKALRVFAYHWAYQGIGGLLGTVGLDGPWDVRRILGTVPVNADGSAYFRVPANTPISVQPLDSEGKAVQLMRSWMTAMPGENVSCVGCHERQNSTPGATASATLLHQQPSEIQPWYGPPRGFSFKREVQPVLDRHCIRCHDGRSEKDGGAPPDLRGSEYVKDFRLTTPGHAGRHGGKFSVAYANLHRYVRRPGIESDYHLLAPLEFHADTTELVQLLRKGHDVDLDRESWDRLITWIDLNAPYHGSWGEEIGQPGPQVGRRRELRKLYASMDDGDAEDASTTAILNSAPAALVRGLSSPTGSALVDRDMLVPDPTAARQHLIPPESSSANRPSEKRSLVLAPGISLELIRVPAGEFIMGDGAATPDELPLARVRIGKSFWMARTEISNEQFALFDPTHDSHVESKTAYQFGVHGFPLNEPKQPVVRVSWHAAVAFCRWLSERTGQSFSLPTEAQWEYACRAGTVTPFSFGSCAADFSRHANLADAKLSEFASDPYTVNVPLNDPTPYEDYIPKENRFNDGALISIAVGSFQPNPWGLHDLHGNVWEWTRSSHRPYPYSEEDGRNDLASSNKKVVRGGSWRDRPARATSAYRLSYAPWQAVFNVGFRMVCEE